MNRFVLIVALVGCNRDKKPAGHDEPPANACTKKLDGFASWFASLEIEKRSYELDFGYTLQKIDRAPAAVPNKVDAVEITATATRVFDVSEHDHASHPREGMAVDKQLAATFGMKASADEFKPAPDDLLRVDVDHQAPWTAVAAVIDGATRAGYKQIVFAFTATPKLAPPPGVDDTAKTEQAARDASTKLDALANQCKKYERAMMHTGDDAAKHGQDVADALIECNCVPDPGEVEKQLWIDARWHQARPRVGVTVALPVKLELAPATPWSAAHAKVLEISH